MDYFIMLERAEGLKNADLFGKSDPYVLGEVLVGLRNPVLFRTGIVWNTLNPKWNQEIVLANIPKGTKIVLTVMDKDHLSEDDFLGEVQLDLPDKGPEMSPVQRAYRLHNKGQPDKPVQGTLYLTVQFCTSHEPGEPRCSGPSRYVRHISAIGGVVTGSLCDEAMLNFAFYVYKVYMHGIPEAFAFKKQKWNTKYKAAQAIFGSSPSAKGLKSSIRIQHQSMYRWGQQSRQGFIKSADDFLRLIHYGKRQGQMRYFTYVLLDDSLRFSETGCAFFTDMLSKHALHSGAAPEVYFAGEFCVIEKEDGSYKMIVDNNSGTYAPDDSNLPVVKSLLTRELMGLEVEAISQDDPLLASLHERVPSRLKQPAFPWTIDVLVKPPRITSSITPAPAGHA